jgi:HPt (histidine-containing phosphotransfer) domain-containing protein
MMQAGVDRHGKPLRPWMGQHRGWRSIGTCAVQNAALSCLPPRGHDRRSMSNGPDPLQPQPSDVADTAVLDEAALAVLWGFDASTGDGFMVRICDSYLGSLAGMDEKLRLAHAQQDWPQMQFAAHTLKTPSHHVGAKLLEQLCVDMERLLREGRTAEALLLLPACLAEIPRVERAVRRLLAAGGGGGGGR